MGKPDDQYTDVPWNEAILLVRRQAVAGDRWLPLRATHNKDWERPLRKKHRLVPRREFHAPATFDEVLEALFGPLPNGEALTCAIGVSAGGGIKSLEDAYETLLRHSDLKRPAKTRLKRWEPIEGNMSPQR